MRCETKKICARSPHFRTRANMSRAHTAPMVGWYNTPLSPPPSLPSRPHRVENPVMRAALLPFDALVRDRCFFAPDLLWETRHTERLCVVRRKCICEVYHTHMCAHNNDGLLESNDVFPRCDPRKIPYTLVAFYRAHSGALMMGWRGRGVGSRMWSVCMLLCAWIPLVKGKNT